MSLYVSIRLTLSFRIGASAWLRGSLRESAIGGGSCGAPDCVFELLASHERSDWPSRDEEDAEALDATSLDASTCILSGARLAASAPPAVK